MKGMGNMLKNIKSMQKKFENVQQELAAREFEGTAGGGMVTVVMTGDQTVKDVEMDPEIFDEGDREMLQDLVVAAVNDALNTMRSESEEEMKKVTGGLPLPGLFS